MSQQPPPVSGPVPGQSYPNQPIQLAPAPKPKTNRLRLAIILGIPILTLVMVVSLVGYSFYKTAETGVAEEQLPAAPPEVGQLERVISRAGFATYFDLDNGEEIDALYFPNRRTWLDDDLDDLEIADDVSCGIYGSGENRCYTDAFGGALAFDGEVELDELRELAAAITADWIQQTDPVVAATPTEEIPDFPAKIEDFAYTFVDEPFVPHEYRDSRDNVIYPEYLESMEFSLGSIEEPQRYGDLVCGNWEQDPAYAKCVAPIFGGALETMSEQLEVSELVTFTEELATSWE